VAVRQVGRLYVEADGTDEAGADADAGGGGGE
jgi:hypothetical protein